MPMMTSNVGKQQISSNSPILAALIGRPNVGKSSLFNRILGRRQSVVENEPGTTRDRSFASVEHGGNQFILADTAGMFAGQLDELAQAADVQARAALADSDLVLFVVDVTTGITTEDMSVADLLRRGNKPVITVVNKCDNEIRNTDVPEFNRLGLGDPVPTSATQGFGIEKLLGAITKYATSDTSVGTGLDMPSLAIVGRPNAGKSSLFNSIVGEERALVSEIPGTTRDAIDTVVCEKEYGTEMRIVDTAGLRRRGRVKEGVERHSVLRSLGAIRRADVCVLLVDASEGATDQDAHIAGFALENDRGLIITANKWDMVIGDDHAVRKAQESLLWRFRFCAHAPLLKISALTGMNVDRILSTALTVRTDMGKAIATPQLNRFMARLVNSQSLPSRKGRVSKFRYAVQTSTRPPTFHMFFSDPRQVRASYLRYIENSLRERYGFDGSPVKIVPRKSSQRGGQGQIMGVDS